MGHNRRKLKAKVTLPVYVCFGGCAEPVLMFTCDRDVREIVVLYFCNHFRHLVHAPDVVYR